MLGVTVARLELQKVEPGAHGDFPNHGEAPDEPSVHIPRLLARYQRRRLGDPIPWETSSQASRVTNGPCDL